MSACALPIVIKAELPIPAVVVVQAMDGTTLLFADPRLDPVDISRAIADIDTIVQGQPYALG